MEAAKKEGRIRVLIVDDEPLARANLRVLLKNDSAIESITECGSGEESIAELRRSTPELLFLDVQMPECDGFDVLERLGRQLPPAIVFVTAHDQYALRALEAGALDYLLKPFDNARFARALNRAKAQIAHHDSPSAPERIIVKSSGQVLFVKISDIDWIEAADYYSCLHVGSKSHMLRRTVAELERDLDPEKFCRVHRSAIVHLDRVEELQMNESGEYDVVLANGARVRLSRTYRKQLQSRLRATAMAGK